MKKILLITFLFLLSAGVIHAKQIELRSPSGQLGVTVDVTDILSYTISSGNDILLKDCQMSMTLSDGVLGAKPRLSSHKITQHDETINPVVAFKFSSIRDRYNLLTLNFQGKWSVEFRAYDDGIAYRFVTSAKKDMEVLNEDFNLNFPASYLLYLQQSHGFNTAYEEPYTKIESGEWKSSDKMSNLPVLIDTRNKYKILISEADLSDYPCLFLKGNGNNGITSTFAKPPLPSGEGTSYGIRIENEAGYIAKTSGKRTYPWRFFVITADDKQIIENTMVAKLASANVLQDVSWVKPGQVSWEYWNSASPYGVDFEAGLNLDTYKYFIDFASAFGIPYILMDDGWALKSSDPYTPNPKVNVHELIRYGKEKNVGIFLWLPWVTVENNIDLFKTFSEWGVKGVKIDFMNRSDQWMVNYYERVANEAAKNQIMVSFHGSFKPAGLEYKYPNVLSYEGVLGLEQMATCTPDNSVYLPFIRNAVGPMDFTPGAMINMQPEAYCGKHPNAASVGTRVHQMAMFVLFETGLQMLCDNPTLYYRNEECTRFLTQIPVTWDETKALAGETGEVVVVAKRKGDKWYIGGITNSKERELNLNLDFIIKDKSFKMTSFEDGINAKRQGMDYKRKETTVRHGDNIRVKMARNGGWAAIIE